MLHITKIKSENDSYRQTTDYVLGIYMNADMESGCGSVAINQRKKDEEK